MSKPSPNDTSQSAAKHARLWKISAGLVALMWGLLGLMVTTQGITSLALTAWVMMLGAPFMVWTISHDIRKRIIDVEETDEARQARQLERWSDASALGRVTALMGSGVAFVVAQVVEVVASTFAFLAITLTLEGAKGDGFGVAMVLLCIMLGIALGVHMVARALAIGAARLADRSDEDAEIIRMAAEAREHQGGGLSLDVGMSSGGDLSLAAEAGGLGVARVIDSDEGAQEHEEVVFDDTQRADVSVSAVQTTHAS